MTENKKLWEVNEDSPTELFELGEKLAKEDVELLPTGLWWLGSRKKPGFSEMSFANIHNCSDNYEDPDITDIGTTLYLDGRMEAASETIPFILGALSEHGWNQVRISMENIGQRRPKMKEAYAPGYEFTDFDLVGGWKWSAFRPAMKLTKERGNGVEIKRSFLANILVHIKDCKYEAKRRSDVYKRLLEEAKARVLEFSKGCRFGASDNRERLGIAHNSGLFLTERGIVLKDLATFRDERFGLGAIDAANDLIEHDNQTGQGLRTL